MCFSVQHDGVDLVWLLRHRDESVVRVTCSEHRRSGVQVMTCPRVHLGPAPSRRRPHSSSFSGGMGESQEGRGLSFDLMLLSCERRRMRALPPDLRPASYLWTDFLFEETKYWFTVCLAIRALLTFLPSFLPLLCPQNFRSAFPVFKMVMGSEVTV